ncbi:MAG: ABC transporter ATP-binding protein [Acetobacteraceae bacterium]|nr:ABC transporter ATP-binding protein [Acetobacteraceae bacterium]
MSGARPIIRVEEARLSFGGVRAVDGVSLSVARGSITGLIGPNGAGKSSLFNIIAGRYRPTSGRVLLEGEDVTGLPPHALFARGLCRTFQIPAEFGQLTVRENLMVVPAGQSGERIWNAWFARKRMLEEEEAIGRRADSVLEFLRLSHVAGELACRLSGGQKKLLELGRTMMAEPKVVLLDEIGAGVNKTLLAELAEDIRRLNRERGITFFLIEHDMELIGRLCDHVVCMAEGRILVEGSAAAVRSDPRVLDAYLGGGRAAA